MSLYALFSTLFALAFDKAIGDGSAYERQKYTIAFTWNRGFDINSKA